MRASSHRPLLRSPPFLFRQSTPHSLAVPQPAPQSLSSGTCPFQPLTPHSSHNHPHRHASSTPPPVFNPRPKGTLASHGNQKRARLRGRMWLCLQTRSDLEKKISSRGPGVVMSMSLLAGITRRKKEDRGPSDGVTPRPRFPRFPPRPCGQGLKSPVLPQAPDFLDSFLGSISADVCGGGYITSHASEPQSMLVGMVTSCTAWVAGRPERQRLTVLEG